MADLKISQLTSATLPLAGTEVLPIVQSSSTKKVATDDLTVKNVRSNATTGILQIAGPGAGATRTMTTPNADFTAARTDAAQSFIGDQTLGTGNLIQGTAAKGVNFTANTPAAGMTSQLLNWYEEGTWTMGVSFGGGTTGITYTANVGRYIRIGKSVTVTGLLLLSNKGSSTGSAKLTGLPFTIGAGNNSQSAAAVRLGNSTFTGQYHLVGSVGTTTLDFGADDGTTSTAAALTDTNFANNSLVQISYTYFVD